MNNQNENPDKESDVKLVFDIMPQRTVADVEANVPQDTGNAEKFERQPRQENTRRQDNYGSKRQSFQPASRGFRSLLGLNNFNLMSMLGRKWIILSILVALILAGGGYLALTMWGNTKGAKTAQSETQKQAVEEPKLSGDWLKKYFGAELCGASDVCGANADPDSDGIKNIDEVTYSTSPLQADTDQDGISDLDEIQIYNTDPIVADSDGDGFEDGMEIRNGFSPSLNNDLKLSALEDQVFKDNIEKFGLNEPTKTFLTLSSFKTNFLTPSTTSNIILSVPKDWKIQAGSNSYNLTSTDAKDTLTITQVLSQGATQDSVITARNVTSTAGQKFLAYAARAVSTGQTFIDEFVTYVPGTQTVELHNLRALVLKNNQLFETTFKSSEQDWSGVKALAETIISSVR